MEIINPAPSSATGATILFLPGGGYSMISFNAERRAMVDWFVARGATVFVLRYRHGGDGHFHPAPSEDAFRAVRWIRTHAGEYGLDPSRIGVVGASAGGHLAAYVSTRFDRGDTTSADPVERASGRPDFAVLFYPVISLTDPSLTHAGSRTHLVGPGPDTDRLAEELSAETHVPPDAPPTFLVYGGDDTTTPPGNGALYYLALRKAGIKAEAHLFETGPHAFGLPTRDPALSAWQPLLDTWLVRHGVFR